VLIERAEGYVEDQRGQDAALCAVLGYARRWPAGPGGGRIGGRAL